VSYRIQVEIETIPTLTTTRAQKSFKGNLEKTMTCSLIIQFERFWSSVKHKLFRVPPPDTAFKPNVDGAEIHLNISALLITASSYHILSIFSDFGNL
jgi:hypothetical protein